MLRRWTLLACLLLVGPYPPSALSLGLGEAVLHSALYEPLNADIQILSADSDALENLDVRLASDSAFRRVGIDRAFYLTDFRFDVEDRSDGSARIRVTSTDPIREPFVDFVMEVQWPGGRMQPLARKSDEDRRGWCRCCRGQGRDPGDAFRVRVF